MLKARRFLGHWDLVIGHSLGLGIWSFGATFVSMVKRRYMVELFILIPGRTSRQGTTLNEGKLKADYVQETSTLLMSPEDMQRLGLAAGTRLRLRSEHGQVEVPCQPAKAGELPPGVLFIPYGDVSSQLMGGNTHGTGMPDSKGIDVELERA
jgi:formylmethanofuran dehydrogenase subunit D